MRRVAFGRISGAESDANVLRFVAPVAPVGTRLLNAAATEDGGDVRFGPCVARRPAHYPFVPAKAGIQFFLLALGPRFRGDERMLIQLSRNIV